MNAVHLGTTRQKLSERIEQGRELRREVPRSAHAEFSLPARDPVQRLLQSDEGRIESLIPLRHQRMGQDPFAFMRGSAFLMAEDLSHTPATGLYVQSCGDCHLMNFGGFGTPERNLVFDINDFDETLPAPWEWDVKRLATSVVLAGRSLELDPQSCQRAARRTVRAYREHLQEFARMPVLDVWYTRITTQEVLANAPDPGAVKNRQRMVRRAYAETRKAVTKLLERRDGRLRFRDLPPKLYHPDNHEQFEHQVRGFFEQYLSTLQDDRRELLERFQVMDIAMKVVGVGSVGTLCAVALLVAEDDQVLLLQFKEARPSVLAPFVNRPPRYANQGQRVVCGQRLMQAASDLFLGWTSSPNRHFYFRQLRDLKISPDLTGVNNTRLASFGSLCGHGLARAHARAGDPAPIAGYLGKSDSFDRAVAEWARQAADQAERDHRAFVESGLPSS